MKSLLVLTYLLCVQLPFAFSATYYVSQDAGSNANDGLSWGSPWKTMAYAAQIVTAGDTVVVRKSATPYFAMTLSSSGLAGSPIVVKGEDSLNPPIVTGGIKETGWVPSVESGVWEISTGAHPIVILEDGVPLVKATSATLMDGQWFWLSGKLYYRPTSVSPANHDVWRAAQGGGVQIGHQSWIVVENISCWVGQGYCVGIETGSHNVVRRVSSQFYARGVQVRGGSHNLVEGGVFEYNREGVYLLTNASYNEVRQVKARHNGNWPTWASGDRSGILVGEDGTNVGNRLIANEVAFNGGPNSDHGVVAYHAPDTVIQGNYVHDNYSGGIMVGVFSHGSSAIANRVIHNGKEAVLSGLGNVSGLTIRRSKDVLVKGNQVLNNYVSLSDPDRYVDRMSGGIDLKGNAGDDMTGIQFIDNISCGTKNGPNVYLSTVPNT